MSNLKIVWDWKESVGTWSTDRIFADLLKTEESTIFVLAKEDVAKILQKSNFSFTVQQMDFDEIYKMAVDTTKVQIKKSLKKKEKFVNTDDSLGLIRTIISRIANNIRNLFDERYKGNIRGVYNSFSDEIELLSSQDALDILIEHEDERELDKKIQELNREYLEILSKSVSVGKKNQMVWNI